MKYRSLEKLGIKSNSNKKKNRILGLINKTLFAIFLGLVTLIVMEYSPKFKNYMQKEVLNKNISFGLIGKLYNKYFGNILPTSDDKVAQVFNEQLIYDHKESYQNGFNLSVSKNYLVPVLESGVVVYLGQKDGIGNVITIEGENGSTITYGNIKNNDVKLYEYINKGKYLGEVTDNILYISILKEGEYLDIETYLS